MSQPGKLTHQVVEQWLIAVGEKNLAVEGEGWHIALQPEPGTTHQVDFAIEAQPVLQVGGGQAIGIQRPVMGVVMSSTLSSGATSSHHSLSC